MIRILLEDEALLIVEKPPGLPTQATRASEDSLYDRLRAERPYLGLHHRLDAPVSGIVLFTTDPRANAAVAKGFREHTIARRYLALAEGEALEPAIWDRPVEGKRAVTEMRPVGVRRGLSALALSPQTGRTHQLRIHAALAGLPLLGDRRYAEGGARYPRLMLHAFEIALAHPTSGAPLSLSAPLRDEMQELWMKITG